MRDGILIETAFFEEMVNCLHDKSKNANKDHIKKILKTASTILYHHMNKDKLKQAPSIDTKKEIPSKDENDDEGKEDFDDGVFSIF